MKYFTFAFDLWPWDQGHEKHNFFLVFGVTSLVQICTRSGHPSLRKRILPRIQQEEEKEQQVGYRARTVTVVHYSSSR